MKGKISICIPVYGVAKHIEKCARSLFEQTFENLEYIFVNDCTKDDSVEILEKVLKDYPNRQPYVKIIHNECNLGSGDTRAVALNNATGEYVIHCDSDDWVERDMYEKLYHKAKETGADITVCKYIVELKGRNVVASLDDLSESPHIILRDFYKKGFHLGLCNKLVRRSLFLDNKINFLPGINYGEDFNVMIRAIFYANKISYIQEALYHYNCIVEDSYTRAKVITEKQISDWDTGREFISNFLTENGSEEFRMTAVWVCFYARFTYFKARRFSDFRNKYKETNKYIMQYVDMPLYLRILLKLTSWGIYLPAKLFFMIKN